MSPDCHPLELQLRKLDALFLEIMRHSGQKYCKMSEVLDSPTTPILIWRCCIHSAFHCYCWELQKEIKRKYWVNLMLPDNCCSFICVFFRFSELRNLPCRNDVLIRYIFSRNNNDLSFFFHLIEYFAPFDVL